MPRETAPSDLRHSYGRDLGTQAWTRRNDNTHPMRSAFTAPTVDPDHPRAKPRRGGMWTSTYIGAQGSDWIQWCLSEEFGCERENPVFPLWTLEPCPDARIAEVDSYADLEALVAAYEHRCDYPNRGYGAWSDRRPHWERIAEDFDAVHLTERGQWDTRLTHPLDLYSWDCESTLWLRWKFDAVTALGNVRVEPYADAWWIEQETAA